MKRHFLLILMILLQIPSSFAKNDSDTDTIIKDLISQELVSIHEVEAALAKAKHELSNLQKDLIKAQNDPDYKATKIKTNVAILSTALTTLFVSKYVKRSIKSGMVDDPDFDYILMGSLVGVIPSSGTLFKMLNNLSQYEASKLDNEINMRLKKIDKMKVILLEKKDELKRLKDQYL